ncbi:MAG: universal stress protein [Candidatus Obscuribacterales bacterium]|nr:universal stress protein [Candidatus Obscuribacterales bacterium]
MRILAAVDGSVESEAALAAMSQHQWPEESSIKLLYVLQRSKGVLAKRNRSMLPPDPQTTATALEEITGKLAERLGAINISYDIVEGDPKSAIVKFAGQWKADLIVMGTRKKKGIDALILGSVSARVLQKADCPVLIVKDGTMAKHIRHGDDFNRILLASDGRETSKAAFAWLARQNWSPELVYKVMSVIPQDTTEVAAAGDAQQAAWLLSQWSAVKDKVMQGLREDARKLGKGLDNQAISVDVIPGNPKEKIVEIARGWRAELIVTGAEKKSHLDKIFQGSVSQAIASKSPCSVLVIKGIDKNGERMTDKARLRAKDSKAYAGNPEKRKPEKMPDYEENQKFTI